MSKRSRRKKKSMRNDSSDDDDEEEDRLEIKQETPITTITPMMDLREKQPMITAGSPLKSPRGYRKYTPDQLRKAYDAVKSGKLNLKAASKKYSVPCTTINDRVSGKLPLGPMSSGPPSLLGNDEEKKLSDYINSMARIGYSFTRLQILRLGSELAIHNQKLEIYKQLSLKWFMGFKRRCPDINLYQRHAKKPHLAIAKPRGQIMPNSREAMCEYFRNLHKALSKHNLFHSPERIFCIDEMGISLKHDPPKIVVMKRVKPLVTEPRSTKVTVISCGNAVGTCLPPFMIFPGKSLDEDLLLGALPGTQAKMTKSGRTTSLLCIDYLRTHFIKYARAEDDPDVSEPPILVILDGCKSSINVHILDWAKRHNIILVTIPAQTSRALHPLHVGCFTSFRKNFKLSCQAIMHRSQASGLSKYEVCSAVATAYPMTFSKEHLQMGFRRTGVQPFCSTSVGLDLTVDELSKEESVKLEPPPPSSSDDSSSEPDSDAESSESSTEEKPKPYARGFNSFKIGGKRRRGPKPGTKRRAPRPQAGLLPVDTETSSDSDSSDSSVISPQQNFRTSDEESESDMPHVEPDIVRQIRQQIRRTQQYQQPDSDSDMGGDHSYNTREEDLCCVCKRSSPPRSAADSDLVIISWAQCDACDRWCHLRYCTNVTTVDNDSKFFCPDCEHHLNMQIVTEIAQVPQIIEVPDYSEVMEITDATEIPVTEVTEVTITSS